MTPGFRPSSCHHATAEVISFSQEAQQKADIAWAQNLFAAGAGQYHYQVLANHHPVLAPAFGRNDPLYSYVMAMIAALGPAAPQARGGGGSPNGSSSSKDEPAPCAVAFGCEPRPRPCHRRRSTGTTT